MLVFDKILLRTRRLNQIVVPVYSDVNDPESDIEGYLYSDLNCYRHALTLSLRHEGNVDALYGLLRVNGVHKDLVDFYAKSVPEPFNMLAPFLGLIAKDVVAMQDLESLTSRLFVIGRTISFSDFIAIPVEARMSVVFTRTSFMHMNEDIRDYKIGLFDKDKAETPDGVLWTSSEEVSRVGQMYTLLLDSFGITQTQLTSAASLSSSSTSESASLNPALDAELESFDDEFDPAEWADYKPTTQSSGGGWDSFLKSAETKDSQKLQEVTQQTITPPISTLQVVPEEEEDVDDFLSKLATSSDRVNSL